MKRLVLGLVIVVANGAAAYAMELARENGVIQIGFVAETTGPARHAKEIVTAALNKVGTEERKLGFGISEVKSRALLLNPLLSAKVIDMGLAWQKPDCAAPQQTNANKSLCKGFFFSKPVIIEEGRVVVLKQGKQVRAFPDMRVCTVKGFKGPVSKFGAHRRTENFGDCFRLLASGQVDGVAGDHLRLRSAITTLKLAGQLSTLDVPVYRRTYHAIIAKSHTRARTLLYYLNGGLSAIRDSGEMDVILAKIANEKNDGKGKGEGE